MSSSTKTIHATVSGRVQGVCYRQSTQEQARNLGLVGWVKNLPDGRVELVAQGAEQAVDDLVSWLHQGPPMAEVTQLDVSDHDPGQFKAFEITY